MHVDVFNGDADGILSLVQLRLAKPKESVLVTGVKRDIELLAKVDIDEASSVTVLDISMEKNSEALGSLLAANKQVFYVDHHRCGDIPESDHLHAIVDLDANTCTALLVNDYLNDAYYLWAIAAAYGDNMINSANVLADKHQVNEQDRAFLKQLGIYINYNGYGRSVDDLHFAPDALYQLLVKHENPLSLRDDDASVFYQLEKAYQQDMANAADAICHHDDNVGKVIELPDETWSRRVSGVLGNELANQSPDKAHAVLTKFNDDSYVVSLRAPLNNKQGADKVCSQFVTGGGRAAAAGINQLPANQLSQFIDTMLNFYG